MVSYKALNTNIEEQEADLHISNSERQNSSPLIILPRQIYCKGDMAGFPITMDILLDETGNITGQYKNIRYGTEMEIKGKQENDGILNMTLNNRKETVLMKLSQTSGNTLEGYAEGGSKQLKVHMNILSNEKSANNIMLKGMINDKYRIVMQIYMDVKNVSGSYYYVKNGSNNTLELSGSMNSNDYMVLKEYNSAGENTGTFEGKWSLNSYSGTFTNYKGVKMPFKLYSETTATNDSDIIFNSYQKSNTSSISNSLSSFFSKNVGKYPSDINLLEFPLLKTRLIALVGNNNYNFIKTYFQVVTPIKLGFNKNPNLYEVSGGEEHNCMSNNITIVYNQQLDNLTVQLIKEGSDPLIFQEKKDDSPFE